MDRKFFEIKSISDAGEIIGRPSTYGNVDRQGDVVERGAFTKTLADTGGRVPLLWQHRQDEPIGTAILTDEFSGLGMRANLDLDVEIGRRAHSALKKGIVSGLSIGYDIVRAATKGGVRYIREIDLFEVSVVTIPANAEAKITGVKHDQDGDEASFTALLEDVKDLASETELRATLRDARRLTDRAR
jgi:HK97 family phage prohead protease